MHSSTLHDGGEAAVDVLLSDFVRAHERPFAMLLKPPHEFVSLAPQLLAKMSAALYGSFNLTELRAMLRHDDGIGEAECGHFFSMNISEHADGERRGVIKRRKASSGTSDGYPL